MTRAFSGLLKPPISVSCLAPYLRDGGVRAGGRDAGCRVATITERGDLDRLGMTISSPRGDDQARLSLTTKEAILLKSGEGREPWM